MGDGLAVITGASRGLGKALAKECAGRGMNLFLIALPGDGLSRFGAALARDRGVEVDCLELDLTAEDAPARVLERLGEGGRGPSLLVNNAGIGSVGLFLDASSAEHEATIAVNALALVRLTRALLPGLRRRGGAAILNVASLGAYFPMPTLPIYSATKSFVLSFSLALREELDGAVGVSVLCPNAIRTTDEVGDYVDRLGFFARCACLCPEFIAREAMDGLAKGRAVIVPGNLNKLLAGLARLVPTGLAMKVIHRYWGAFGAAERKAGAEGLEAPAR